MAKVMEYLESDWKSNKCYEKHKPLAVGEYKIYGGSASWPVVKDADIYVSLQDGSTSGFISDPWDDHHVIEVQHFIPDGGVPKDPIRFSKMIAWICNQLQKGKKIHVGCIGGHGRTGMVLSAVVAQMTGEKNATEYVRKHYCMKAVESERQVKFLHEHFGVTPVIGHKEWNGGGSHGGKVYIPAKAGSDYVPIKSSGSLSSFRSGSDKPTKPVQTFLADYQTSVFNARIPEFSGEQSALILSPIRSKRNLWKK
jgi:hypothetical protein